MLDPNTVSIIIEFLSPLELSRLRCVNRFFRDTVSRVLQHSLETCELESYACPMCGGWYKCQNLNDYSEFFDTSVIEGIDRMYYILS